MLTPTYLFGKVRNGFSRIDTFIQFHQPQYRLFTNLFALSIYLIMESEFIPAVQSGQLTEILWIPLTGLQNFQGASLEGFRVMMFIFTIWAGASIYQTASRTPRRLVDGIFGMGAWRSWKRSRRFRKMEEQKQDANVSAFTESFILKTRMPIHYVTPGRGVAQLREDEHKYAVATES